MSADAGTEAAPAPDASGAAIAYDKVAQAASLAVQDAADYQRNTLAICAAAQGKALAMMLQAVEANEPGRLESYALVFTMATLGSASASATAAMISEQAAAILRNFPRE